LRAYSLQDPRVAIGAILHSLGIKPTKRQLDFQIQIYEEEKAKFNFLLGTAKKQRIRVSETHRTVIEREIDRIKRVIRLVRKIPEMTIDQKMRYMHLTDKKY